MIVLAKKIQDGKTTHHMHQTCQLVPRTAVAAAMRISIRNWHGAEGSVSHMKDPPGLSMEEST